MKRLFSLHGRTLDRAITWGVVLPGFLLFGYNNSVAGGLVELKSWVETFPIIDTERYPGGNTATLQGLTISLYILGLAVSCLMCIYIGPRLGRIRTLLLGTSTTVIGAIIQASSNSWGQLIAGRLISGLTLGMATCTFAVYQQECSIGGAHKRGSLAALEGAFNSGGLALANWMDLAFYFTKGSVSWRFPLAFTIAMSIYVCFFCLICPESPRWLMHKGREVEAREVVSTLVDNSTSKVETVMSEMRSSLSKTKDTRFRDLLKRDDNRLLHRTLIAAASMFFQQWTGINAVASYNSSLFLQIGLTPTLARILSACAFTWFTITSVTPYFLVERLGRRKLLLASSIGMSICMAVLAGVTSVPNNEAALIVGALFIFLYLGCMGLGFYGIPFFYAVEIGPHAYRSQISSIAYCFLWTFAFIMAEITPIGLATIKYKYFIIFAVTNAAIAGAVYVFFPETMGLSLEQIDQIFVETESYFDCVGVAKRIRKRVVHDDGQADSVPEFVEAGKSDGSADEVEKMD